LPGVPPQRRAAQLGAAPCAEQLIRQAIVATTDLPG
jgi:hypothetical protein